VEPDGEERLVVTDAHVAQALDELLAESAQLTRVLLGGARHTDSPEEHPGKSWLLQANLEA